ncbi:hypothetical protein BACCAP_03751 [Pseudoflavonifractor capillosus ATCC 29799]|uniref:Uncharacterized protein n=1 Tax=Pseudoflavonifractor capillosus ATCC 29799 TaxID=411467 RepID=A6NZU6_9FIRM|nr:hypothetical protein BACCAP_03751 [Pseudoflavonifractor capillosus ATCC 29799]
MQEFSQPKFQVFRTFINRFSIFSALHFYFYSLYKKLSVWKYFFIVNIYSFYELCFSFKSFRTTTI